MNVVRLAAGGGARPRVGLGVRASRSRALVLLVATCAALLACSPAANDKDAPRTGPEDTATTPGGNAGETANPPGNPPGTSGEPTGTTPADRPSNDQPAPIQPPDRQ